MYSTPATVLGPLLLLQYSPISELGPLGPWLLQITLRIRRSCRMPDWLTLYRASDPGSSSLDHVCVFPCRRMCHAMSMMGPRACTNHARTFDPHVPMKLRELAPIPNVTSSPGVWPRPTLPRSGATDVATRLSFHPHFAQNG
jgi:hypothetical protein